MFGCKIQEITEVIYSNEISEERVKMILDSVRNHERQQELQHTGSVSVKNRRHRAVQVCLWLLCVLLLTGVIVLCVYFTTDRKHLITHNNNLTKEREKMKNKTDELLKVLQVEKHQCLMNITRLSEERNQLKELDRWLTRQGWSSKTFTWIYYNFSFYYISSEVKSWSDSREDCKQRGADLVIIKNKEEQEFLQMFTKKYNYKNYYLYYYWIGLRPNKGEWRWVDDTTLTTKHWINGDPNAYYGNCAVTSTSGWTHYSCDAISRWICEKRF